MTGTKHTYIKRYQQLNRPCQISPWRQHLQACIDNTQAVYLCPFGSVRRNTKQIDTAKKRNIQRSSVANWPGNTYFTTCRIHWFVNYSHKLGINQIYSMCTFRISNWFVTPVHSVLDWNRKMYFTPHEILNRWSIALAFLNQGDQNYFK